MVTVPADAAKLPLTARFPVTAKELLLVTVPLRVKFAKLTPVPLIVLAVPLMVIVPLLLLCVNCPGPLVNKFPVIERLFEVAVMPEADKVRLLMV